MSIIPSELLDRELQFNPFANLFSENEEILSRLYKRSLYEKYIKMLTILTGKNYNFLWNPNMFTHWSSQSRYEDWNLKQPFVQLGLFDYVTLGTTMLMPLIGIKMGYYLNHHSDSSISLVILTCIFQGLLSYPMIGIDWIIRFVFGLFGLLVTTPLIIAVHFYVNYIFRDVTQSLKFSNLPIFQITQSHCTVISTNELSEFVSNHALEGRNSVYLGVYNDNPYKCYIAFDFFENNPNYAENYAGGKYRIQIATSEHAHFVKQLAKANVCKIGSLIKNNRELENYINEVETNQAHGLKEAREILRSYLTLMRKFTFELVDKIFQYIIKDLIIYTNVKFCPYYIPGDFSYFNRKILTAKSKLTEENNRLNVNNGNPIIPNSYSFFDIAKRIYKKTHSDTLVPDQIPPELIRASAQC